ncbi:MULTISPECIES: RsfA family transcriptional regulator [Pontibacillus]|uniref:RsfA family transcriptional regulator n=1 Tax=Pontibacillus chungwhensis TaxID=265426 RepID=A0ABY8UVL2_9BACI|nr:MULTISPECIES: RsfA family transcriptional regulator [Pontibacillus]MCD5323682.1 RsfA family transcriptional regulator [Pontibacillus sp. HN14]WIF97047.1 RsfA family transcriptional regulator [Pontibacillus chungwhensis]
MVKVRQDAWSHEDDLLLAETVLRHIREGSTQLRAFDEVGDHLNRTSAACGFRWNAEIRKKYDQAIDLAKRQRKEKKRALAKQQKVATTASPVVAREDHQLPAPASTLVVEEEEFETVAMETQDYTAAVYQEEAPVVSFDHIIRSLRELKRQTQNTSHSKSHIKQLEEENQQLQDENNQLQNKLRKMEKQYLMIQEDYQVLMQVMDRARKMIAFDEDEQFSSKPAFRMEKNGNLEQVAR